MLSKFLDVIQCKTLSKLFNNTFDIRHLTVYIEKEKNKTRLLNNNLFLQLILTPFLIKLYTKHLPKMNAKKFIYDDDTSLAC